jgi:hypothetical protein
LEQQETTPSKKTGQTACPDAGSADALNGQMYTNYIGIIDYYNRAEKEM